MTFANEIKDFLSAYTTVTDMKVKKDKAEQDKVESDSNREYREAMIELRREELDISRQRLANQAARTGGGRGGSTKTPMTLSNAPKTDGGLYDTDNMDVSTTAGRAQRNAAVEANERIRQRQESSALDLADKYTGAFADDGLDEEDPLADLDTSGDWYEPTKSYADGGMVEEDEPLEEALPTQAPAPTRPQMRPASMPTPAQPSPAPAAVADAPAPPAGGKPLPATPDALQPEKPDLDPQMTKIILRPAEDAVNDVGKEFISAMAAKQDALGENEPIQAMTPKEFQEILKTVDPSSKLPNHLEVAAALGAVYSTVDDPAKRYKLSQGILTSAMQQSMTLASIVPQALEAGKVDEVCRLLADACNRFPTGHKVELSPIKQGFTFQVTDADGKVVEKGNLTPEELLEFNGSVADGTAFMTNIYQFANANKRTAADPEMALDNVATAAGRIAGIEEQMEGLVSDDPQYEVMKKALNEAREGLRTAQSDARRLGVKRTDISGVSKDAVAIPFDMPEEPVEEGSGEPGFWSKVGDTLLGRADPNSPSRAQPAPAAIPEEIAPASPPPAGPATPPVTPSGNNAIATPKNKAEFDALPSGARFKAPDGTVRVKP